MISSNGYWIGDEAESQHVHDPMLSAALSDFFIKEGATSIIDLGCGMGKYVKDFRDVGLNADGFDGNPNTPTLSEGLCGVCDLSIPLKFDTPYDWVMSLEVGEHLPKEFETVFIENLHANNKKGIILSWAVIGQGGHGHVNERNNDYIRDCMTALGYTSDEESENALRSASSLSWFMNTIMVFRR